MTDHQDSERLAPVVRVSVAEPYEAQFAEILGFIRQRRMRAWVAANQELVELYWNVGEYLSRRAIDADWGKGTVQKLSDWLLAREPGLRGFSPSNLWRMKQFFELYDKEPRLAPLVRVLPWSSNLLILAQCKTFEEREFYLRLATEQRWPKRELERQLEGGLFERTKLGEPALSPALTNRHPNALTVFKERYMLEFLKLSEGHAERDLQQALISNLKQFLLELGRDFCFVGEQFCVQVGAEDFFIDLLFYHRSLQALVAIELKVGRFKPADLGQLQFYLEALDRDHKKPHENPSIGVLLCKSHDKDVVEYALARTVAPALVAQYETKLPDKALLRSKMDEIYAMVTEQAAHEGE
jgi:predicted nuclease of restriction endonuclease-like (RecB) superfamily